MFSRIDFAPVTDAIRSASTSIETRFLDMGSRLGNAVETIGRLTQTFDRLAKELRGENLRGATHELSQIMSHISTLAHAHVTGAKVLARPSVTQAVTCL
jgi:hypothetical protein